MTYHARKLTEFKQADINVALICIFFLSWKKISSLSSPTHPHPSPVPSESLLLVYHTFEPGRASMDHWCPGPSSVSRAGLAPWVQVLSSFLCPLENISYVLGPGWFLFCCLPLTQWLWIWALGRGNRVCPLGLLPPGWEGLGRIALPQPIPGQVSPLSHPLPSFPAARSSEKNHEQEWLPWGPPLPGLHTLRRAHIELVTMS